MRLPYLLTAGVIALAACSNGGDQASAPSGGDQAGSSTATDDAGQPATGTSPQRVTDTVDVVQMEACSLLAKGKSRRSPDV